MEQFVLVYSNKCMKTQTVTKQKLPKYQDEKNPRYQIVSLKKKKIELSDEADALFNELLSCFHFKLSNLQTLKLDGVKTGFWLSVFAQQLCSKNADVPDIYFTLVYAAVISSTPIVNQDAKTKQRGRWVPFKS